jgi:hypothetical protein
MRNGAPRGASMKRLALVFAWLATFPAQAQGIGDFGYKHAENHEWYSKELPPRCCNDGDCRETIARFTPNGWLALVDGEWTPVPERTILRNADGTPKSSRDQKAHVCASKFSRAIFCFLPPDVEG